MKLLWCYWYPSHTLNSGSSALSIHSHGAGAHSWAGPAGQPNQYPDQQTHGWGEGHGYHRRHQPKGWHHAPGWDRYWFFPLRSEGVLHCNTEIFRLPSSNRTTCGGRKSCRLCFELRLMPVMIGLGILLFHLYFFFLHIPGAFVKCFAHSPSC